MIIVFFVIYAISFIIVHINASCLVDRANSYFANFDLVDDFEGCFKASVQVDEIAIF